MCKKDTVGQTGDAGTGQDLPHPSGPNPQLDPFDYLPSATAHASTGCDRQRQSSRNVVRSFIGTIISGALGLAVGGFILYLILPKHHFDELLTGVLSSSGEVQGPSVPSRVAKQPKPKNTQPTVPHLPPQRMEDHKSVVLHSQSPRPDVHGSAIIPLRPKGTHQKIRSQPPHDIAPNRDVPTIAVARPPQEIRREIVLDLAHSVAYATFAEVASGNEAEVKIEGVVGLGTPFEFKPIHGVVRLRQPVDIVLNDYPGISIHVSLAVRNGTIVKVAPKVAIGQNRKVALTQRWVKQACVSLKKEFDKVSRQLLEATITAQNIEIWLKSPVAKPLQLRGVKVQQLHVLRDQIIPSLSREMNDAKSRVNRLRQLFQLVEQIDGTACIHLVMKNTIKDVALPALID